MRDMGSRHWWSSLLATWMCGLAEPKDFGSSWSFTELNSKRVNSSICLPAARAKASCKLLMLHKRCTSACQAARQAAANISCIYCPSAASLNSIAHAPQKNHPPPALNKCRSGGGYIILGHVFLQLPVSVSSGNKQGYAWLALHEAAAKRGPRRGILQLTHSYRWGSENCNLHFLPPPLLSTGG